MADLQQQLRLKSEKVQQLEAAFAEVFWCVNHLVTEPVQLLETNERQIRAENESHEEISAMQAELLSFKALVSPLHDEIVGLQGKLRASQQRCTELEADCAGKESELSTLRARLEDGAADWLAREQDLREELVALMQSKESIEALQQELMVCCAHCLRPALRPAQAAEQRVAAAELSHATALDEAQSRVDALTLELVEAKTAVDADWEQQIQEAVARAAAATAQASTLREQLLDEQTKVGGCSGLLPDSLEATERKHDCGRRQPSHATGSGAS